MKPLSLTVVALASVLALPAMAQETANPQACLSEYQSGTELFPARVETVHSEAWTIEYHANYKVITTRNPRDPATPVFTYVLVQCGTPVPDLTGPLEGAAVFEIPLRRVTQDVTIVPLELLGRLDVLAGWDSETLAEDTPYAAMLRETVNPLPLGDVSNEGVFDVEAALNAELDGAFLYWQYGSFPQQTAEWKIPVVWDAHAYEPDALASAEWLKLFAAFLNEEAKANEVFAEIETNMEKIAERAARSKAEGETFAYIGFGAEYFIYSPVAERPDAALAGALGATNVFGGIQDSVVNDNNIDYETALTRMSADDVVFMYWQTAPEVIAELGRDARYAGLPPFAAESPRIFVQKDKSVQDFDCYGLMIYRPDLRLKDFALAYNPASLEGEEMTCYEPFER